MRRVHLVEGLRGCVQGDSSIIVQILLAPYLVLLDDHIR